MDHLRTNEYKLRLKEIGNPNLNEEQKANIRRLLDSKISRKIINIMYGTSYQQLKALRQH
ncbi:hypothetical protein [Vibrio fluvialis]|uniref:hypothetical protein n=1 Tax=Vibrio fluvialis TaxID=676 RepID=UPI001EEAEB9F|nr:hypothetical protein [Vibrio fluvialis]MCG6387538.1 hypothetical protein [Vibrio fluvialis]